EENKESESDLFKFFGWAKTKACPADLNMIRAFLEWLELTEKGGQ
ncbi:770_t:CDS:1, partial [Racocetra persica]